ncbi:putative bifunctional inhibitor/plant lipid transfer protein/seed storage helical [Helianthus annuus]|nr:putative bifunctional inhibitor/plant lipid transfer protein/seed storage helical [Helianthus annuus]
MGSRNMSRRMLPWLAMMMVLVRGDFDKDQKQCGDTLVGLATCLPYVSGEAKAPTMDCCAKLKPVLDKSKVCLCILVKDRDEPSLGVKINGSLALGLPDSCHLPANITECPSKLSCTMFIYRCVQWAVTDLENPHGSMFIYRALSTRSIEP